MSDEIRVKPLLSNGALLKANVSDDGGGVSMTLPYYLYSSKVCVVENITIPNLNSPFTYYEDKSKPATKLKNIAVFTYYCETGTGLQYSTLGDGSPTNPFKSLQYALDNIIPIINCIADYFCENDFYVQLKCSGIVDYEIDSQVACKSLILNGVNFEVTQNTLENTLFTVYANMINSNFTIKSLNYQTGSTSARNLIYLSYMVYNCKIEILNSDNLRLYYSCRCLYATYIFNCQVSVAISSTYTNDEDDSGVCIYGFSSTYAVNNQLEFNIKLNETEHRYPYCNILGINSDYQYNNSFKSNISMTSKNTTSDNYFIGINIILACFQGNYIYNSSIENVLAVDNTQIEYSVFPSSISVKGYDNFKGCYNCTHTTIANVHVANFGDEDDESNGSIDGYGYHADIIDNCTDDVMFSVQSDDNIYHSYIDYFSFWVDEQISNCTGVVSLSVDGWKEYCGIYSTSSILSYNNFVSSSICTKRYSLGNYQYQIANCSSDDSFYSYCKS